VGSREMVRAALFHQESWGVIPGAEPSEGFSARVAAALARAADLTGPDRVAVAVTHGGVIAEACHQITQSRPFAFFATENGSITRVIRDASGHWSLVSYNDTTHLRIDAAAWGR
jgi:probable phosphoglycerate mutase